jgi:hypothetical protein
MWTVRQVPRCVMYLFIAVAQRGGPLPRLPSVVHEFDLYLEDDITADDHEFRSAETEAVARHENGLKRQQRQQQG